MEQASIYTVLLTLAAVIREGLIYSATTANTWSRSRGNKDPATEKHPRVDAQPLDEGIVPTPNSTPWPVARRPPKALTFPI